MDEGPDTDMLQLSRVCKSFSDSGSEYEDDSDTDGQPDEVHSDERKSSEGTGVEDNNASEADHVSETIMDTTWFTCSSLASNALGDKELAMILLSTSLF